MQYINMSSFLIFGAFQMIFTLIVLHVINPLLHGLFLDHDIVFYF